MTLQLVITGCKERPKIQNAMQLLAGTLESIWTFRSSTFGLSSPRPLAGRKADRCQDRKRKAEIKSWDLCCQMVSEQHTKQCYICCLVEQRWQWCTLSSRRQQWLPCPRLLDMRTNRNAGLHFTPEGYK